MEPLSIPPDPTTPLDALDATPIAEDSAAVVPPAMAPEPAGPNWALAGEALASVTGLFPEGPITPEQGREAEGVIGKIAKSAEKFCEFREFGKFKAPAKVDFEETWARLQPLAEAEIAEFAADLIEPDLIDAWSAAVNRAREVVRSVWPVAIRETPTGPEWLEPSATAGGRARTTLALLNDPTSILDEMQRAPLTPSMVEAVKIAFPELC